MDKFNLLDEVEKSLKEGVIEAYQQNIKMCYDYTEFKSKMVEYLIVVNIAQKLMEWTLSKYIQVHLEYSLRDFYNNAFPYSKCIAESIFDMKSIYRENHNPENNKSARIDIVITQLYEKYNKYQSLVGIEVKSINSHKGSIIKDIHRLSKPLSYKDKVGENSLIGCYSLFFRRLDNPKKINTESDDSSKKKKELIKWNSVLNDFKREYPSLNYNLKSILVQNSDYTKIIDSLPEGEIDYSEVAEKTGLIMCYIIKITK
jgi:hypothetical protein